MCLGQGVEGVRIRAAEAMRDEATRSQLGETSRGLGLLTLTLGVATEALHGAKGDLHGCHVHLDCQGKQKQADMLSQCHDLGERG